MIQGGNGDLGLRCGDVHHDGSLVLSEYAVRHYGALCCLQSATLPRPMSDSLVVLHVIDGLPATTPLVPPYGFYDGAWELTPVEGGFMLQWWRVDGRSKDPIRSSPHRLPLLWPPLPRGVLGPDPRVKVQHGGNGEVFIFKHPLPRLRCCRVGGYPCFSARLGGLRSEGLLCVERGGLHVTNSLPRLWRKRLGGQLGSTAHETGNLRANNGAYISYAGARRSIGANLKSVRGPETSVETFG